MPRRTLIFVQRLNGELFGNPLEVRVILESWVSNTMSIVRAALGEHNPNEYA